MKVKLRIEFTHYMFNNLRTKGLFQTDPSRSIFKFEFSLTKIEYLAFILITDNG